jgi:hypothetical protein
VIGGCRGVVGAPIRAQVVSLLSGLPPPSGLLRLFGRKKAVGQLGVLLLLQILRLLLLLDELFNNGAAEFERC